jgi:DNA-binding LytR/AlgR family response regulator
VEVVKAFDNPQILLAESPSLAYDFCIIDIEMPEMNGLQLAKHLKDKPIIFATAYKDYAADAYDLNALDYMRKPITLQRLEQAVDKVFIHLGKHVNKGQTGLSCNTNKGKAVLSFDEILIISADDNDSRDKNVQLRNGESLLIKNSSFDQLLEKLPRNKFCRINKQEIIALEIVISFSANQILVGLKDKFGKSQTLHLSNSFKKDFFTRVQY